MRPRKEAVKTLEHEDGPVFFPLLCVPVLPLFLNKGSGIQYKISLHSGLDGQPFFLGKGRILIVIDGKGCLMLAVSDTVCIGYSCLFAVNLRHAPMK